MKKINKVILAYSGGLDTSIMIHWLKENYGCEVIAVVGDVGQGSEVNPLREKALKTGASKIYIEDLREDLVNEVIFPSLKANATYEDKYLLGTAFARPLIGKRLVEIALKEGADAIVHGCTGKGNDQVRFEMAIKAFAPNMTVIAPWRTWELKSREDEIAYAEARNIDIPLTRETNYSKDKNLWHLSHEGLDLENPSNEPNYEKILELTVTPEKAPNKATYVTIHFEKGVPTKINGETLEPVKIIEKLNELGGENAIGIVDLVENRLVGMKSRGVYETPGGSILYYAHKELETLTIDRETLHYKEGVGKKLGELLYYGQWYSPLREALMSFVNKTQEYVTGDVKLKLYKGNIITAGIDSQYSLYDEDIATFDEDEVYNQNDSEGFINLYGLPSKVVAMKRKEYFK
ncbi:argininosuccinate synthase [Clostridium sp.]|uniref:argininosuccinate synthase n=1 Tax=Clostridium sp. TaxID=1506 RepID=UPI00399234D3